MVDWSTGRCPICGATDDDFAAPSDRRANFARLGTYSAIVARLQWNEAAIDMTADARAWPTLAGDRRARLMTLLSGFCVAEPSVAEHIEPFAGATNDTLLAWVLFLQRRDEDRHARLFDRIAAEVLGLAGDTPAERLNAARKHAPAAILELFESRLPALAAELAAGHVELAEGVRLYHMLLEGVVFTAGQKALLDDLEDGALPGVREGVTHVDLDERWHVGLGLRYLNEARPSPEQIRELLRTAATVADVWGDAVGAPIRDYALTMVRRRLAVAGLLRGTDIRAGRS